jgi:hypothetical protein
MSDPQSLLLVHGALAHHLGELKGARAARRAAVTRPSRWPSLTARLRRPAIAAAAPPALGCCTA